MVDKLIEKVIEDAEKKKEDILQKAREELQKRWDAEKEKINQEFEKKLLAEKEEIDKTAEMEIVSVRMDAEKKLLAVKNSLIEEVEKKIGKQFNNYLNENMKDIISLVKKQLGSEEINIKVPEGKDGGQKDESLKNAFKIEGEKWEIVFGWEQIKSTMTEELKQKISSSLFGDE
jgi:vacuolar-type H+-ATPase subunit E/Vma4